MIELVYGSGDCPSIGGAPNAFNCPCVHFVKCVSDGVIPVCIGCTRNRTCALAPTQSCSLFQGFSGFDDEDHYQRKERERARFGRNQQAWVERRR
jgi:hypothetical protein